MSKLTSKEIQAIVPQHIIDMMENHDPKSFGAVIATTLRKERLQNEIAALKRQLACENRVKPASFVGSQTIAKVDRKDAIRERLDDLSYDRWCILHDSTF